jgi:hypothetical protein
MTLDDMEAQVRILVAEPTTEFITDQNVTDAINRVLPEVAMETEDSLTWISISTVDGQANYGLPDDFLKAKHLYLHASASRREKLMYLTTDEFERMSYGGSDTETEPDYYKIEKGSVATDDDPQIPGDIWLYPIPDAVYTLRFYYYQLPESVSTGTDIVNLHTMLHMAVCYRAARDLAYKKSDYKRADRLSRDYEIHISKAKQSINVDQRDRGHVIKDAMGYGNPDLW